MNRIFVVGIGPGNINHITPAVRQALAQADTVCGYGRYLDRIRDIIKDKECIETGMTREVERCRLALQTASLGKTVALVCSGDPGVYGMAGLLLELAGNDPDTDIEICPGISAAMSGAAALGAPLMNDFAVISLSDLLTPWEEIEQRLHAAAAAGFILVLYNPASTHRKTHLAQACSIILQHRPPETVCGWVRNICLPDMQCSVLRLDELSHLQADMMYTIFIGSQHTKIIDGKMVTSRGYKGTGT